MKEINPNEPRHEKTNNGFLKGSTLTELTSTEDGQRLEILNL